MENLTSGSGSGESCLVGRQNGLGQRILTYLHTHGSADRRELLHECFARHVSASRLDEALDALLSWAPPRITVEVQDRRDGLVGKPRMVYRLWSQPDQTWECRLLWPRETICVQFPAGAAPAEVLREARRQFGLVRVQIAPRRVDLGGQDGGR